MSDTSEDELYTANPQIVADHNDQFRRMTCLQQSPKIALPGRMFITPALSAFADDFLLDVIRAVGTFTDFTPDNDPEGYHDFGAITIEGEIVFFKIDIYEAGSHHRWGSETPDQPKTTDRVLTIMLASDW